MSEKEPEAKMKEFDENDIKELIEERMGRSFEEIDSDEILTSRPHEELDDSDRRAIAKWIQKDFKENNRKLNDLHFKAAITAGLVEEGAEP